ncbi:hypothetical protein P43SY_001938 [Pythium insidiosum]|uniref:Nudix hydrolase domain-containing protein n=1 Tax=Pythium insidiosum TaxID=114742 RepID=A0AAD5QAB2_PYTIN|nr:hypothetical protein P43SY_001938 [Pythium insidiosum]
MPPILPLAWQRLVARTSGWTPSLYVPLRVALADGELPMWRRDRRPIIGRVRRDRLGQLVRFADLFVVSENEVLIRPAFDSVEAPFRAVSETMRSEGAFPLWQEELYAAKRAFSDTPAFLYNRGVGSTFGLSQFATHLNGFVRNPATGAVDSVWIATRSYAKKHWPGRLDTVVGGGLPAGTSALENMVKESYEEAGFSTEWTRPRMVSTGSISYLLDDTNGLQNNTMFVYDLELPSDVTPRNMDNEVASFELWPVADVLQALGDEPERFKPDICLVLLDFAVRHGVLTPDNTPDLQLMERSMRSAMNPFEEH